MAMRWARYACGAVALGCISLGFGTIHRGDAAEAVVPLWVDLSPDGLTVYAEDVPLRTILDEIARVTDVRIRLDDAARDTLSIAFEDVPIEEGLRRILRGKNFFIVSVPRGSIERAHVYERTRTTRAAVAGDEPERLARIRTEAVANPDRRTRSRALERLAAIADSGAAIAAVIEVLERESDPRLVERALDIAGQDPATPLNVIVKLAQSNSDHAVRLKALTYLSERGGRDPRVRHTLEILSADDPAPEVRDAARRALRIPR